MGHCTHTSGDLRHSTSTLRAFCVAHPHDARKGAVQYRLFFYKISKNYTFSPIYINLCWRQNAYCASFHSIVRTDFFRVPLQHRAFKKRIYSPALKIQSLVLASPLTPQNQLVGRYSVKHQATKTYSGVEAQL